MSSSCENGSIQSNGSLVAAMDEKADAEKNNLDEVVLPGFRFHPTDQELVGFYLKRKVLQKPLSIELIRQLDIYKYDPWELPKLAATGEKEWYFYCPRDRKYRNSARPNRVTGAGFWKATGTDRPIYSSDGGTKCIGLKKSLVFYKGRAAKGIKTDWMMHEFRLPPLNDASSQQPKRPLDKNIPVNDLWAICRIFKKTSSMVQRALSHSWVSPALPQMASSTSNVYSSFNQAATHAQFGSENISSITDTTSAVQYCGNHILQDQQQSAACSYPAMNAISYRPVNLTDFKPTPFSVSEIPTGFMFAESNCTNDIATMLLSLPPLVLGACGKDSTTIDFRRQQQQPLQNHQPCSSLSLDSDFLLEMNGNLCRQQNINTSKVISSSQDTYNQCGASGIVNFPFNVMPNLSDAGKPNATWDATPRSADISTSYSPKCFS